MTDLFNKARKAFAGGVAGAVSAVATSVASGASWQLDVGAGVTGFVLGFAAVYRTTNVASASRQVYPGSGQGSSS